MSALNKDQKKNVGRYRHDPLFRDGDGDLILFFINIKNQIFDKRTLYLFVLILVSLVLLYLTLYSK
jgi:hypothetical protein